MPRFEFRLATLLRVRENARDEKRAHLAEAYRAATVLEERHAEMTKEIAQTQAQAQQAASAVQPDLDYLLHSHRYAALLRAQLKTIEKQQAQVAAEVERRRLALVEADRQVRVLEKLREKRQQEFTMRELAREQKMFDEVAQYAPARLREVLP